MGKKKKKRPIKVYIKAYLKIHNKNHRIIRITRIANNIQLNKLVKMKLQYLNNKIRIYPIKTIVNLSLTLIKDKKILVQDRVTLQMMDNT